MEPLKRAPLPLFGLEFDNITLAEILPRLLARPADARFAYIVTPNADHIARLWRIPELAMVYREASSCLLDSQLIGLCADRLGLSRPAVVTGADLTAALLARLDGVTVAVIGMRPGAFQALTKRYPRIRFLHHAPPMGLLGNPEAFFQACDFACASHAAFTFIALGSPVQELLAYAIRIQGGAGIGLCIGSALDFSAGAARRAPPWMRERGLEWLHRLAQDPLRLAERYLINDPRVFAALALTAFRQKAR
jgi:exopolysaccharide biosynthesis WecB/TagA/CpsF family protein